MDKGLRGRIRKVVGGRSLLVSTQELGNGNDEEDWTDSTATWTRTTRNLRRFRRSC